jgi:predicted ribonuclease toxin of YeeF-YezG toxin-antitoxin module
MTKEELKQEAEKSLDKRLGTYAYIRKQDCYTNYVDGYIDSAEPREKRIAELEDKLANADYQLKGRDNEIRELEAQIEKMKNCKNCANYMISGKCPSFFRTGWCKNWEMAKGVKND